MELDSQHNDASDTAQLKPVTGWAPIEDHNIGAQELKVNFIPVLCLMACAFSGNRPLYTQHRLSCSREQVGAAVQQQGSQQTLMIVTS